MNKAELAAKITEKTGIKKTDKFISAFIETVSETLEEGDKVQLIGFGTFEVREREARNARNPKTGEIIKLESRKVPAFKPGRGFRDAVNK